MIETFYRAFTAAHDLADLGIGKLLDELKDEQVLALGRKTADDLQQGVLVLTLHESHLGRFTLVVEGGSVIERDLLVTVPIPVPVGDKVMRNPVKPGRERYASIGVILDVMHGPVKDTGGQVFRIVDIASAIIDVVKDAVNMTRVQYSKGFLVPLRSKGEDFSITQFEHVAWQCMTHDQKVHLTDGRT
jgi:hypothetical protein